MSRKRILFPILAILRLKAFTHANRARFVHERRSTSGQGTIIGDNVVTWPSIKETVVPRSSAKSLMQCCGSWLSRLMWLQLSLKDLEIGA